MNSINILKKGFTLIELTIVMAVLLVVVGTAVGIFISVVRNQRAILAEQELLNQGSYVLEYMSKALRMAKKDTDCTCLESQYCGYNYQLTNQDTLSGAYLGIRFINQSDNDACQEFYLDNTLADPVLKVKNIPSEGVPLTSDKFQINSIRFGINGRNGLAGSPDEVHDDACVNGLCIQPRITIFLDIDATGDDKPSKKFQTTISQRNVNAQQ